MRRDEVDGLGEAGLLVRREGGGEECDASVEGEARSDAVRDVVRRSQDVT